MSSLFFPLLFSLQVLQLDAIASRWELRAAEAAELLARLEQEGRIRGLVDDRGLYIYLSDAELAAVAQFVRHKGRVSLAALAAQSNKLVDLAARH